MKTFGLFPSYMNSSQASRWEKIRAKGKLHFTFFYGMCLYGGIMFVFLNAIHFFHHDSSETNYVITSLILWPIAGLVCGLLTWNRNEASYQFFKSEKELDSLIPPQ